MRTVGLTGLFRSLSRPPLIVGTSTSLSFAKRAADKFSRAGAPLLLSRAKSTLPPPGAFVQPAAAEQAAGSSFVSRVLGFAKSSPFATNIILATLKTGLCDLLVQKYIEKKETIDWKRNGVFLVFGGVYLGGVQWFIYVTLFKRWWPGLATFASQGWSEKLRNAQGLRDLGKQVAFDNFVHYPIIYFPVFYVFKQSIQKSDGDASMGDVLQSAMRKYRTNCIEDNLKMWALWIPGDLVVYSAPMWLRLPLNHFLSFIWCCYLSFLRGGDDNIDKATEDRLMRRLTWHPASRQN
jgi:hypothetical protein